MCHDFLVKWLGAPGPLVQVVDYSCEWLNQRTIFVFQKLKFILPLAWGVNLPCV